MMLRRNSPIHQLPLEFGKNAEQERMIEARVAIRAEAAAMRWRFRLILIETAMMAGLVLAAGLARDGQIELTHSVSAGLDYAAIGPEHAYLKELGRVEYTYATDDEALAGFKELSQTEGLIPALESAHAIAYVSQISPYFPASFFILSSLSFLCVHSLDLACRFLLCVSVFSPPLWPFSACRSPRARLSPRSGVCRRPSFRHR